MNPRHWAPQSHRQCQYWGFFFLLMHSMGLEPITLPFTLLLQGEKVPFELELIDMNIKSSSGRHNKLLHSSFFVILATLMDYFHTF